MLAVVIILNVMAQMDSMLVSLEEYKRYLRIEERDDKLNQLLS